MKLVIRDAKLTALKMEVVVMHNNEEIIWNIGSLDKVFVETKTDFDLFEQINAFWNQLKSKDQDDIFQAYKNIRFVFDDIWDRNQLTQKLYTLVAELLDKHNLKDAQHWILFHSNIYFPDATILKTEYVVSVDRPGTREQTYLKEDYIKLITMSMVLRCMVPIWGEFIGRTRAEAGTIFKEFYAFRLLNNSQLASSEAMDKLKTYVEYSTAASKNKAASIIGGVSSEDFPLWVLGLVVTRKVCVGDIRGLDSLTTLITFIYNFIHNKIMSIDNSFNAGAGMIKDKSFEELSQDGEKNLSRLEGYKAKQELAAGDIIALEFSVSDPFAIANRLAPGIDLELVRSALKTTEILNNNRIFDSQIILLQWVMKTVIPTKGVVYLCKTSVVRLLAVCQAVLWHRGHKELAGLCTAVASDNKNEMQISGVDSRARIPKEMIDEIHQLFPYMKRPTGKQKTLKLINQALLSIDNITDILSESDWSLTVEDKYLRELNNNTNQRRYSIGHNIKILLASLVIQTAKRNF